MKTIVEEVKSKSVVVARPEIPVYETLEEAVHALGSETCLSLINTQNGTNIKNAARALPSKKALEDEVMKSITPEVFAGMAGDIAKLREYLDKGVEALRAKYAAQRPGAVTPDEGGNDEA
jgi:hypothetical protein